MASGFPIIFTGAPLWTPSNLGGGLIMWLDADDTTTIILNGSTVSQWSDKSGNNNHATQSTASLQPAYNATYTSPATPPRGSSVPAIVTSATGQNFVTPVTLNGLSGYNIYAVLARTGNLSAGIPSLLAGTVHSTSATANRLQWKTSSNDALLATQALSSLATPASGSVTTNVFAIAGTAWDGSVANVTLNGTVSANSASPFTSGFDTTALYLLGHPGNTTRGFIGATLEFVMASTYLSVADRQKLEGYLAWHWNLQGNLPVTHPYFSSPPRA